MKKDHQQAVNQELLEIKHLQALQLLDIKHLQSLQQSLHTHTRVGLDQVGQRLRHLESCRWVRISLQEIQDLQSLVDSHPTVTSCGAFLN